MCTIDAETRLLPIWQHIDASLLKFRGLKCLIITIPTGKLTLVMHHTLPSRILKYYSQRYFAMTDQLTASKHVALFTSHSLNGNARMRSQNNCKKSYE